MDALSDDHRKTVADDLGRLFEYWKHIDSRMHSTLQLIAGAATLLVAGAGLDLRSSNGGDRQAATLAAVLFALAGLAAATTVVVTGNQAGKLAIVLAMERLRAILVDDQPRLIALPTFGRLHIQLESIGSSKTADLDAITRNDYRPLATPIAAAAGALGAAGACVGASVLLDALWPALAAGVAVGIVLLLSTMAIATAAARLLGRRMARGFAPANDAASPLDTPEA